MKRLKVVQNTHYQKSFFSWKLSTWMQIFGEKTEMVKKMNE